MYYNLLQNWQKPFTVEMYRNTGSVMLRTEGREAQQRLVNICSQFHWKKTKTLFAAGRSSAGAVQAVCNGPSMSAAQSTTPHDALIGWRRGVVVSDVNARRARLQL